MMRPARNVKAKGPPTRIPPNPKSKIPNPKSNYAACWLRNIWSIIC